VRRDIDRTFDKLARCRGAILAVGNHLPGNIPDDSMDGYLQYLGTRLAEGRKG